MKIDVLKSDDLNSSIQDQISKLFQQLSENKNQISLNEILDKKNNITLAYCTDNSEIVRIASMCTYEVISGKKGWIEDVVVNSGSRRKGIGRKPMNKLLEVGEEMNLSENTSFHRGPSQT